MNLVLFLLQQAPDPEEVRRALNPIWRNGRENISYLYSLDGFDWTVIVLYFTLLGLLAILGVYRLRMVYHFWRYRDVKPQPQRRFADGELPRVTVQLPLFNELYVLVDGGTAWENGLVGQPDSGQERFATLECFDYPFYETLDVRFYGSFPLLLFWPDLEKSVMRQFAAAVGQADLEPVTIQATRARTVRKQAGAVPHDLGMPDEDPWLRPNAYHFQDVNRWKDLNAKWCIRQI
ncbi:MAG: hypothetical protein C4321_05815 [Chloroflexota bacterium]